MSRRQSHIGLVVLLLMVVFRWVVVPVRTALGFLLSVGAAFDSFIAFVVRAVIAPWSWHCSATGPGGRLVP